MTTFLPSDRSIAVEITAEALASIVDESSSARRLETGGLLLGRYGRFGDRVVVSRVTGPPRDSRRFPRRFIRGIAGLTKRLARVWDEGIYYVGEWHLHPGGSPAPSVLDTSQMLRFSDEADYRCPHPVLLVIGGRPPVRWSLSVGVVIDGAFLELEEAAYRASAEDSK